MRCPILVALALLAALPAGAQDPEEYPGLLVVSAPPEEAGEFTAGVCDPARCLLPPPEGIGPTQLVPVRDPGYPDLIPPVPPDLGCTTYTNADEVTGSFALVQDGGCDPTDKFFYALNAGAVGIVLYHDESVGPDDDSTLVNIDWEWDWLIYLPGLFVSRYRGERLLAAHGAGQEVVAEMRMNPDVVAAEPPPEAPPFALTVTPNPTRGDALVRVTADSPLPSARLSVLDVLGREVAVLHAGPLPAGPSTFRLPDAALGGGVSLFRLAAETADGRRVSAARLVTRVE
ncbi:MAG: PA domain-containing protein [Rubricoccaceae bacterium]|nr:PA domain-containing protein [Rubricoccaceae bacterium]